MATGFNKQFNGQNLVPQNTIAPSSNGDMRYNSSTNKVELYNGAVDRLSAAYARTLPTINSQKRVIGE